MYYYITGHGIGPGTKPKDLRLGETLEIVEEIGFKTIFRTTRELTEEELNWYDINKWCHKCKKVYKGYGALSRRDNKTEICSECGVVEALEDFCKESE